MRSMKLFVLIPTLISAVGIIGFAQDSEAGGGTKPAPVAQPPKVGPTITFVGESEVYDKNNSLGTYTAIEKFEPTDADADVKVTVGASAAYLHIGYAMKEVKNKKTGKVTKVVDREKPLLEAFLPNMDNLQSDGKRYTNFGYSAYTIRWGALVKVASATPGTCIRLEANGLALGRFALERRVTGGAGLTVYKIKVPPVEPAAGETGAK